MVFCEVTGPLDAPRLREAARRVRGIRAQSVRVATQPAALSFAVDSKLRSPQAAVDAVQRALAGATRLTVVRLLAGGPRPAAGVATP